MKLSTSSLFSGLLFLSTFFGAPSAHAALPLVAGNGGASMAAIDENGNLWMWGVCDGKEIPGNPCTGGFQATPYKVGGGYRAIQFGSGFQVALKSDGSLWTWGNKNYNGELGNGSTSGRTTPAQIGSAFAAISVISDSVLALKSDGSLWAWGKNDLGQLGDGTRTQRNQPTQIGSGYAAVVAGDSHGLALKSDGSLWAWGCCNFVSGAVSPERNINETPVQIGTDYKAIAYGVLVKNDGSLWTYGTNSGGELGNGSDDCKGAGPVGCATSPLFHPWPQRIGTGYAQVGGFPPSAVKDDGSLWIWGYHNDIGSVSRPTPLGGGFVQAAGKIAVKKDGSVWAWGDNSFGQLGNGTTAASAFPTPVSASDGKGSFHLKSVPAGTAQARFSATLGLPLDNLFLTVNVGAASADQGKKASLFIVAGIGNAWYCLVKGSGWQPCGGNLAAYDNVTLGSHQIDAIEGANLTPYAGADVYAGYGSSAAEMFANGNWQWVARLK